MFNLAQRLSLWLAIVVFCSLVPVLKGQTITADQPRASAVEKPSTESSTAPPADEPTAPSASGVDDGIPCLLNATQLARLRGHVPSKNLTQAGAQQFQLAIDTAIDGLVAKDSTLQAFGDALKARLTGDFFIGDDASQSVDEVRKALKATFADAKMREIAVPEAKEKGIDKTIVDAAINAASLSFEPPPDVACSMSLLTWQETSDIFGLRIAKEYVAVQVVVRNLNKEDEYLLHDVLLAVDTDPCGSFNQFDAARDRLLVRGVALRNQFTDPRNRWVRILEGVGTVASSAVGFASKDYSLGLGVYNSVTPAAKSIFPDYTIDQLNRISDLSFTSSGQTRTVVGKDGVAMFVTFFPSKPFEQSWWINEASAIPGADAACLKNGTAAKAHANDKGEHSRKLSSDERYERMVFHPKPVPYEKWKPNALLAFREHTFISVAGVHITPETDLLASVDELSCPEVNGYLNLHQNDTKKSTTESVAPVAKAESPAKAAVTQQSKAGSQLVKGAKSTAASKPLDPSPTPAAATKSTEGVSSTSDFPCPVKGKNLDKVTQLRLRDAKESTDTITADGVVAIKSGDSTQAVATFKLSDLEALTGDTYNVFWMDKTKVENKTDQIAKLTPYLTGVEPSSTTLKDLAGKPLTLTLTGTSLDLVKEEYNLVSSGKANICCTRLGNSKTTELTLSCPVTSTSTGKYSLDLLLEDGTLVTGLTNNTVTLQ